METERIPVRDVYHGTEIEDPYRWLEGSAAPEIEEPDAELDARVSRWMDERNAEVREVLDARPGREELEGRLRALLEVGEVHSLQMARDRTFYLKRSGSQAQAAVLVRRGTDPASRVLLDPRELDPEGLTTVSWISPSQDGRYLAFGLFRSGDENDVLHVLDVAHGTWLAEEIPGKVQECAWVPDGSGFFYRCLADMEDPYSGELRFHRLGEHHRHDRLLMEQEKEGPLATTWGPFGYPSRDGRWLILGYYTGTDSNDLWVADLDLWFRTGRLERKVIVLGERGMSQGRVAGDVLYMETTVDAPNGRLVGVDLHRPEREHWREILPERETAVLSSVSVARGVLAAVYTEHAVSRVETFDLEGAPRGAIELPGPGDAGVVTRSDRTDGYLVFTSFNSPMAWYRVDLLTRETEIWERLEVPADLDGVEVRQVFFPSKDGTKVPMFLVSRKGLEPDGERPTLLTGYGGFGIPIAPYFNGPVLPFLEKGGLYAVAGLRGGGEYGEEWHRAGMLEKKQNVFDDVIAAGEWLIGNGYTNPGRLAVAGGSNGGLLAGAALTQRPDLFAAVVSSMPLLDMLRYQHFLMAKYWVPEYGSSDDPEQFEVLEAYSPYHRVEDGTAYPAVLFVAGEHDTRVHALHARKMAARVRAATTSDPAEKPVLVWVDRSGGHGRGKPLANRVRESADFWSFLTWQLGVQP